MKKQTNLLIVIALIITNPLKIKAQDTILKVNNEIVISKIIEIAPEEIKYQYWENLAGPIYSINKREVACIKYKNGMVDNFNRTAPKPFVKEPITAKNADTVSRYIVTLNDGTRLIGKVTSRTKADIIIVDNNIGEKKIARSKIKSMELQYGSETKIISLIDGSIISGQILNKTDDYTVVKTKDLGTVILPASKIKQDRNYEESTITNQGKIWFKNPNCTRYLFAPSAYQLKKGEGYYQNIYGAFNAVNYGINDFFTIGGGITGPIGAYLNAKAGVKIVKNVNLAVGVLVGNSFFEIDNNSYGIGLGFGVLTVGNYDHNITFGAGYGIVNNKGFTDWMLKPVYTINGMVRISKGFALVSENWIVNVQGNPFDRAGYDNVDISQHYEVFYSYAFRYMGQKTSLDAGFVNTPGLFEKGWYIGVPYIGFVIRFGNYKEE